MERNQTNPVRKNPRDDPKAEEFKPARPPSGTGGHDNKDRRGKVEKVGFSEGSGLWDLFP
jgi:hypothetical protein